MPMETFGAQRWLETFERALTAAEANPAAARQIRDALLASGLLRIFTAGGALDLLEVLEADGAEALRAHLSQLSLAELRALITAHNYDPEKRSARWRSTERLADLILAAARAELEAEQVAEQAPAPLAAAAWML